MSGGSGFNEGNPPRDSLMSVLEPETCHQSTGALVPVGIKSTSGSFVEFSGFDRVWTALVGVCQFRCNIYQLHEEDR